MKKYLLTNINLSKMFSSNNVNYQEYFLKRDKTSCLNVYHIKNNFLFYQLLRVRKEHCSYIEFLKK